MFIQVKLDLTVNDEMDEGYVSTGSFVMYNCARLATLFRHFEEAVENGRFLRHMSMYIN